MPQLTFRAIKPAGRTFSASRLIAAAGLAGLVVAGAQPVAAEGTAGPAIGAPTDRMPGPALPPARPAAASDEPAARPAPVGDMVDRAEAARVPAPRPTGVPIGDATRRVDGAALPAPRPEDEDTAALTPIGAVAVREDGAAVPEARPERATNPIEPATERPDGPALPLARPADRVDGEPIGASVARTGGPTLPLPRPDVPLPPVEPVSERPPGETVPPDRPAGYDPRTETAPRTVPLDAVAKEVFGGIANPAPLEARSIGAYSRGCLAGGVELAEDGAAWQAMRPGRNRAWGHPELIDYLERLAADAPDLGWRGLLVGDLAQPRGGPMLTGHASHQIGLDADIWLMPMPDRRLTPEERNSKGAVSVLKADFSAVNPNVWTDTHVRLLERAASDPEVARIFVHPAIKRALCVAVTPEGADRPDAEDARWLRRIRPWYGHHYHFHVRLACPVGAEGCKNQAAPPPGAGCGAELDWWFTDAPYKPRPGAKTRRPMIMASLPRACRTVATAR